MHRLQYETQKTSKLHTTKHGPCRDLNHVGTVYTLECLVTKVIRDSHIKLLSEYKHDENNINIDRVAKLDDEYSDIIDVLYLIIDMNQNFLQNVLSWSFYERRKMT